MKGWESKGASDIKCSQSPGCSGCAPPPKCGLQKGAEGRGTKTHWEGLREPGKGQAVSPPANFGRAVSLPSHPAKHLKYFHPEVDQFLPPLVVLGKQRRQRRLGTSRPGPARPGGGKVGADPPHPAAPLGPGAPLPPPFSVAWACASPKCVFWMRQRISCLVSALRLRRGGMEAEQSQAREGQVQVAAQERAGGGEPGSLLSPLSLPFSFSFLPSSFFLFSTPHPFFSSPHPAPRRGCWDYSISVVCLCKHH